MMTRALEVVKKHLLTLQEKICSALEALEESTTFVHDTWRRANNSGGGRTCVMSEGNIFEKAGVNFSHVLGEKLPAAATAKRPELTDAAFQALGLSVVIHPRNPYVPTTHFNVRFFIATPTLEDKDIWWFGGGFDLTPYYGFKEDCVHWHQTAQKACAPFGESVYPRYKKWADDYFYLKHRHEHRGIGGVFFDDLNEWGFEKCFAFVCHLGDHFLPAYLPLVKRRQHMPYGSRQRDFQCYRRGRYAEFNLIYDRGTLFGLQFGGRTESILVSLPPAVTWRYDWSPAPGTPESRLSEEFLVPQNWV